MSNENNTNTQEIMNKVMEISNRVIDSLNDHEKTTLKDLVDVVISETGLPISKATGLVSTYVHEHTAVVVERGRDGGIFKGGRPAKLDTRPRCDSCYQVLRPIGIGSKTINEEVIDSLNTEQVI